MRSERERWKFPQNKRSPLISENGTVSRSFSHVRDTIVRDERDALLNVDHKIVRTAFLNLVSVR